MNEQPPEPQDETTPPPEVNATPEDVRGSGASPGRKFTTDSPTMAEIRQRKKPNVRKCVILLDSSLSHQIDEVAAEIEKLMRRQQGKIGSLADTTQKKLAALEDKLEELEDQAAKLSVEFSFQDLGRLKYDDLLKDHPPTEGDQEMWKNAGGEGRIPYSLENFPPALVSATSLSPKISLEDAHAIFEEWGEGDLELLFNTAILACKEPTSLPKSRAGTAKMRASQQNSTTALNEDSPTQNS